LRILLALDLADAGFDHSVLCEFRGRLLGGDAVDGLLARLLDAAREGGLLKSRGRQRTDSTHVLAAIRTLNWVELVAETLRAALNAIAAVVPDWLRAVAPAPRALPRPGQDGPAARRHRRSPQFRPYGRMVRAPPTRADPDLAIRRARRLKGDFANRVRPFQNNLPKMHKRSGTGREASDGAARL
jgi:hypothetical protein